MSASVKAGFAIGFVIAAILGGLWSWREGMWRPSEQRQAQTQTPPQSGSVPRSQGTDPSQSGGSSSGPAPAAPSATPTPRATEPGVAPTPGATPPGVTPTPGATPPGVRPPSGATPNGADAGSSGAAPSRQAAAGAQAGDRKGAFDIVRVEPSGDAVVAGRCVADCTAELTANGRVIDTAKADAGGSFAMTPSTLPPGDHQLGLTVTTPDGRKETSEQTVTVSVPEAPSKEVVVVLNEPNAPSQVLQRPGRQPAPPPPAKTGGQMAGRSDAGASATEKAAALSLGAIDAERGRFFLQGTAPAGSKLRIYLNNALISEATAGADGRWSLRVERGLTAGGYTARVDHVDAGGKVVKRAESSFDYEGEVAASPAPAGQGTEKPAASRADASKPGPATAPGGATPAATRESAAITPSAGAAATNGNAADASRQPGRQPEQAAAGGTDAGAAGSIAPSQPPETPAGADPANPVVASIDTARVKRGDSLWRISRTVYGQGRRYTIIFNANDAQIRDPDLIYPGQVLVVPSSGAEASAGAQR